METIRHSTFETNSSSCHCMVVANDEDYQKFVNGELFADQASYKSPYQATLITLDEVVARFNKHVDEAREYAVAHKYNTDIEYIDPVMANWLMHHPEYLASEYGDGGREQYITDHRDGLTDELYVKLLESYDFVTEFILWIDFDYTPYSFAMLEYYTDNFTYKYDDWDVVYESYRGKDIELKDGTKLKEMNAVWYY